MKRHGLFRNWINAQRSVTGFRRPRRRSSLPALAAVERLEPRMLLAATPLLVTDVEPEADDSSCDDTAVLDDGLLFTADDGRMWDADGTVDGTVLVEDADLEAGGDYYGNLAWCGTGWSYTTFLDDSLVFTADEGTGDGGLWDADGLVDGTVLVEDTDLETGGGYYGGGSWYGTGWSDTTVLDDPLFFTSVDEGNDGEFWTRGGGFVDSTPIAFAFRNVSLTGSSSAGTIADTSTEIALADADTPADAAATVLGTVGDGPVAAASGYFSVARTVTTAANRSERTFVAPVNRDADAEPDEAFLSPLSAISAGRRTVTPCDAEASATSLDAAGMSALFAGGLADTLLA